MADQYFTETVYSGSINCPGCNRLMTPLEADYTGETGLCASCRNKLYKKNFKSAMTGGK